MPDYNLIYYMWIMGESWKDGNILILFPKSPHHISMGALQKNVFPDAFFYLKRF